MAEDEPELPEFPGHTAAFGRIMRLQGADQSIVRNVEPQVRDVMKVRGDELVLLSRLAAMPSSVVDAEVARRSIAAADRNEQALRLNRDAIDKSTAGLVEFRQEAAIASRRLETLTKWLIAFTIAVVALTVVLVVHDLTP
jgi:hypothetical protein